MARGMMERVLNPEQLDQWFDKTAQEQYTKDLLFSSVFDIMIQVVSGSRPTVHAAHQASKEEIGVSVASVDTSSTVLRSIHPPSWFAMPPELLRP
jgi:hypothetical protein